jgi:hypothetical protein
MLYGDVKRQRGLDMHLNTCIQDDPVIEASPPRLTSVTGLGSSRVASDLPTFSKVGFFDEMPIYDLPCMS